MRILALDPGPVKTAWCLMEAGGRPLEFGHEPNDAVRWRMVTSYPRDVTLAVEMIASYGMAVGAEVFDTCVWIGRFIEAWQPRTHAIVYRKDEKMHLCGSMKAKDSNIRQSLIDLYGGKDKAIGRKAAPGPLFGMSGDEWAALAVAVTYARLDSSNMML